ncbi:enoyl-CoA hydratase/isomerase family protein [Aquibacillus sp. 3ASR75-11]|uniref:Enoyl-CoA hydratase/isomerase family protein n=1 Tax=Terrihalobacillus insolitus TaxID=2950438 RepID=A0A9X3WUM5_9BACI|nr:enoyl-CoA hydratase/isomerase family protein [Terrihalobacillus insolitus]MDC3412819.1 enoyl-CoA hydratase/isomerase family protein [Terrihalobacillus insolitus]MDC3423704.1 enoyl-CoA hydratase/isomerase family protein [Terrihalobacillus insolitus]
MVNYISIKAKVKRSVKRMAYETIEYEHDRNGFIILTLNRPEKRNAVSSKMASELADAVTKAENEQDIKCLVITAKGDKTFCAGGDLTELHGDLSADQAFHVLYQMKQVLYQIASFPVPTICLLNGEARGGGCELATACDFRFAVENQSFGFVQGQLGITPGWGGGVLLYERITPIRAYQWLMESEMYNSKIVQEWGWINKLVSREELNDYNRILSPFLSKPVELVRLLKQQYSKKLSMLSLSALMDEEVRNCARLWESPSHKDAVNAFLDRKAKK